MFKKLKGFFVKVMGDDESKDEYNFPNTLEGFGYKFNNKGELRSTDDDSKGFEFNVGDRDYNQKRYEAIGEVITEHVYTLLKDDTGLQRISVPVDAKEGEPQGFFFMSDDALTNPKLLVLIHGSGVVRAGQWTRKLIINNNINIGSQLPYIRQAFKDGYGVIVLNTNLNSVGTGRNRRSISLNESPEDHGIYVFKEFVLKSNASCIAIVAHSYGGIVTKTLADTYPEFFRKKVFVLAFTDSVHSFGMWSTSQAQELFSERGCNFVACYEPLKTQLSHENHHRDAPSVSAGTEQHEWTSHTSIEILFDFLARRLERWASKWKLDVSTDHEFLYNPTTDMEEEKTKEKMTEEKNEKEMDAEETDEKEKKMEEVEKKQEKKQEKKKEEEKKDTEVVADMKMNQDSNSNNGNRGQEESADSAGADNNASKKTTDTTNSTDAKTEQMAKLGLGPKEIDSTIEHEGDSAPPKAVSDNVKGVSDNAKVSDKDKEGSDKAMDVSEKAKEESDQTMEVSDKDNEVSDNAKEVSNKGKAESDNDKEVSDKVSDKAKEKSDQTIEVSDKTKEKSYKDKEESEKAKKESDQTMEVSDMAEKVSDESKEESGESKDESDQTMEVSDKAQEGSDKAKEGSDKAKEGSDKAKEGSDKAKEGSDKAKEESDQTMEVPDKSKEESDKAKEGSDKAKEEADKAKEGSEKAKEESDQAMEVSDKPKEESDKNAERQSDKDKRQSEKPKGQSDKNKQESDKAKGKPDKAKGQSEKAKGDSDSAKTKSTQKKKVRSSNTKKTEL